MKNSILLLLFLLSFTASKAITISGITISNVLCNGGSDGTADISAAGAISYSLNGAAPVSTSLFTGLTANSYTVVVTDASITTASSVFTITEPAPSSFTSSPTGIVSCCVQEFAISAIGGTAPYIYSEDGGINYFSMGNVGVGGAIMPCGIIENKTIYAKDANNCISTLVVSGAGPGMTNVMLTYTVSNVTTSGGTDGKIENLDAGFSAMMFEAYNVLTPGSLLPITPSGGTMFAYENLPAGTYIVKRGWPGPGSVGIPCGIPETIVITEPALRTAHYSFNYGDARDEVATNDGVVHGATLTTDRFGNLDHAYQFNISNSSKIIIPNNPANNFTATESFSIAYWTKIDAGNVNSYVLSKHDPSTLGGYIFGLNSNNTNYCNGTGSYTFFTSSATMQDVCADGLIGNDITNWQFIVGTYNATTNSSRMYVNGVLQTDMGSSTGNMSNPFDLYIGSRSPSLAVAESNYFNGKVDDISIYKGVLSTTEINNLYTAPNPVTTAISETELNNKISISPNPAHDVISVSKSANVIVTDITGKKIIEKNNTNSINISSVPNGLYIIQLFTVDGKLLQTNKIIKE